MIYSKLLESNSPLQLAADLETFLQKFNTQPNERTHILFITQSESNKRIEAEHSSYSRNEWHGTITIVYEAKRKIEYN